MSKVQEIEEDLTTEDVGRWGCHTKKKDLDNQIKKIIHLKNKEKQFLKIAQCKI